MSREYGVSYEQRVSINCEFSRICGGSVLTGLRGVQGGGKRAENADFQERGGMGASMGMAPVSRVVNS